MKEGWEYKKIGAVCDIYQPKTISKKDFVDNPRFYTKDNVFYLDEHDRWDYIKDNSKKNNIFTIIDEAFKNLDCNIRLFLVQNSFSSLILILSMIFRNSQQ